MTTITITHPDHKPQTQAFANRKAALHWLKERWPNYVDHHTKTYSDGRMTMDLFADESAKVRGELLGTYEDNEG